jgi:catechol 2,3-dioxygenase-like lactoylglutathione lyase family enzyme
MADPLRALKLPVVPVEPREEFGAALLRRLQHRTGQFTPAAATARYFVTDLDAAVTFYTRHLGFAEELRAAPAFAMLYRGDLRLLLSVPGHAAAAGRGPAGPAEGTPGAAVSAPGELSQPGGSNRIVLGVPDLAAAVSRLRSSGVRFRTPITAGIAVRQALLEDPSGNLVELFEPVAGYHEKQGGT